jgi:hypothetical protein
MKFMMLMIPAVYRAGTKVDPGFVPDPEKVAEMGRFNDEMAKSVTAGARVSFAQGKPIVTDGPFIETKEVLGGYWLVEAKSKDEVMKWAQRCPASDGDVIEIRQVFEPEDFAIQK